MTTSHRGRLIVVEGPDGAGKSVLCTNLATELRRHGVSVLSLREPGGCELSEHLRQIVKGEIMAGALSDDRAEALLFAACRAQLFSEVVRPALGRGEFIICDRGAHSTLIYQGIARGLGVEFIRALNEFATGGLVADRVLSLQVSEAVVAERMSDRRLTGSVAERGDRIEDGTDKQTIRALYRDLSALDARNVVEVDANGTPAEVLANALTAIEDLLT